MHPRTPGVDRTPSLRPILAPLSGLLIAQFVTGLSTTVVATSIPTIINTLDGPPSHSTWLIAATILGNTASTPIWGRLADTFQPKRILQIAILIFVLGSVVASVSATTPQLLAARAMQGVGLGGSIAVSMVVVAVLVSPRQRGRVNSYLQGIQTTAMILGPVAGGLIVESPLGWRGCFLIALPIAIASMIVIARTLRITRPRPQRTSTDFLGALLTASGVTAILICITTLSDDDWSFSVLSIVTGSYGLLAIIVLIPVEVRAASPVVPLRLLRLRTPVLCVVASFTVGSSLFGPSFFVTQYLQTGLQIGPAMAGFMLAPLALGTIGASYVAGRAISVTGRVRPMLITGTTLMIVGNVTIALGPLAPVPLALTGAFLLSAGLGSLAQNLVLVAQTAADDDVGTISAMVMFFHTLGGTFGLVLYGAVLAHLVGDRESSGATQSAAYAQSMPVVFALSAGAVAVGFVAVLFLREVTLRATTGPVPVGELAPVG
jgi:MFS family permease